MKHFTKQLILACLFTFGATGPLVYGQPFEYALFELPNLTEEYHSTWASGINNCGILVGTSYSSDYNHAVLWDNECNIYDLGVIDGTYSGSKDINDYGEVVGFSSWDINCPFCTHAFLWQDGTMFDLGTLGESGESNANAINDLGVVVGKATTEDGRVAFVWEDGVMTALPGLKNDKGVAYDVNNNNQVVGVAYGDTREIAVLWQDGEIFTLPSLNGDGFCYAYAINNLDQIVGQSEFSYWGNVHACAWVDGEIFDLHDAQAGGPSSSARGINNVGQVVGYVGKALIDEWGFIWDQENGMRRLNDLLPPMLVRRWRINVATDINDLGQIAAYGVPADDHPWHPFLITPVYPTFDLSLATPGVGGEVNTITASNLEPGTQVYFTWSRHGGGAKIPGCDIQTNALQIENPKSAWYAVADENGDAILEVFVAPYASGLWVLVQAVVPGDCAVSNLVVQKFE